MASVGEANVQDRVAVVFGDIHSSIDSLQNVRLDELALSKDTDAGAVSFKNLAVLGQL